MKIDLEMHDLGPPCKVPEHQVLGLTWRYKLVYSSCVRCRREELARLYAGARSGDGTLRSGALCPIVADLEERIFRSHKKGDEDRAWNAAFSVAGEEEKAALRAQRDARKVDKARAASERRAEAERLRTPRWADRKAIKKYCREVKASGKHVDHIVPLQGRLVSGLNVLWNLRAMDPFDNVSKNNKFDPDTYVHELPSTAAA